MTYQLFDCFVPFALLSTDRARARRVSYRVKRVILFGVKRNAIRIYIYIYSVHYIELVIYEMTTFEENKRMLIEYATTHYL